LKAFSPLTTDGKPLRKFSERTKEHWFHGDRDGLSYAALTFGPNRNRIEKPEPERTEHIPLSLTLSEPASAHDVKLRRGTFSPQPADKIILKGSMAKVVSANAGLSLPRLI